MHTHTLVIDYETYFDAQYSLQKTSTLQYIRDPQFVVHGAACKLDAQPAQWLRREELGAFFDELDWTQITVISHNYLFDGTITYEKFDKRPAFRIDTLGLARALLPADMDFDLDTLATALGVGSKLHGGAALHAVKGKRVLTPQEEAELARYALNDAEVTYRIYELLWPHLPQIERRLLDITCRLSTEGVLLFNAATAAEALLEAQQARAARIANGGVDPTTLRSAARFAEELRARGVEPPTKYSEKRGQQSYAFSKQDPEFVALREHPEVAALVDARLAAMSSGDIHRIERLLDITSKPPYTIPMPLNYCGAHTHRWSGGGKINPQNLKKAPDGSAGKLRKSFEAPDGHVIVVVDSSQIELRGNLWFCGQHDILDILRQGGDVYSHTASRFFQRPISKRDIKERQFGKVIELGCGYGMGHRKFRATCAIGPMGNPPIRISEEEARLAVDGVYRPTHPYVVQMWNWLSMVAIPHMGHKGAPPLERGPVVFEHEGIRLPNGLALLYPNLHWDDEAQNWTYGTNGVRHKIYGGLLLENIIQALARIIVAEQLEAIDREIAPVVTMTHDEVVAIAPESRAEEVYTAMLRIMSTPPTWAPDLPVAAEGGYAKEYSK